MNRRWRAWVALLCSALVVGGWIVFLVTIGLDRADQLSSVVGTILAAVFGVAGLVVAFRTWPGREPPPVSPPLPIQINQASGNGRVYGVQGGNLIIGDPGPPDER